MSRPVGGMRNHNRTVGCGWSHRWGARSIGTILRVLRTLCTGQVVEAGNYLALPLVRALTHCALLGGWADADRRVVECDARACIVAPPPAIRPIRPRRGRSG